ncbi:protein toll-like [Polistes fuscatus]|uniref:protein toll-like n=1 Tax=Polistes fuscatus TaxID=30207 RepID=UPI001CA88101|nr:protein toll-like [Polistes fuscatus]
MTNIFLITFYIIFTTINANIDPCEKNAPCQCLVNDLNDIRVFYKSLYGAKLGIGVKSWSDLQIDCKYMDGRENFDLTSEQSGKILNSLEFKHCELPNITTLKNLVKKLGVEDTNTFIFKSFKKLNDTLKREHLQEFSNVTKLNLSHNGLTNISYDLFWDLYKLEYLDMSVNNLTLPKNIFQVTRYLKGLELHGNNMKELVPGLFYDLPSLELLNLMGNELVELDNKIFDDLSSLKDLNLGINSLSKLPELIFHKLERLEIIDLSCNKFLYIPRKLFDKNKKVRQVLLYRNKIFIPKLPDYFLSNLEELEEVVLSSNALVNLTENLFWNSSSLKYISLNHNFLETLPQNIFRGLQNVEKLIINNNMIDTLPDGIFKDLKKLKLLDLSINRFVSISRYLFEGLTSLTELNMERNQLKHIEHAALFTIRNLTIARFSYNQLQLNYTNIKQTPFFYNNLLKELHLSNNEIEHFFSYLPTNKLNLRLLDLSHNQINTISASNFILTSKKIQVDLRYNKIRNILLKNIENLAIGQTEKRDVEILVQYNPLLCDCNLYDLLRYLNDDMSITVYNYIDIMVDNLTCKHSNGIDGPIIKQLNYTTYKCLEHDYFEIVEYCQFGCTCSIRPYDRTRVLDCSNRNMSVFLIDQLNLNFVGNYPLILNLTGNFLTEIPSIEALEPLNVTGLLLSNNNISQITVDKLLKSLTVLEMHNNNISKLDENVISYFTTSPFKEFTLSGNPLICNCDTKYVFEYVKIMRFNYKDLNNVKCKNMDLPLYNMTIEQFCPSIPPPSELDYREELNETSTEVLADF